jgi:Complex I intermediate-associated protein 30 (CIA30)
VRIADASGSAGPIGWGALDDVVMGGVSSSGLYRLPGGGPSGENALAFRGMVSEANNGGFASVRSRNYDPPLDLSAYKGLRIQVCGDGRRYKLTLRCSSGWDTVGYTAGLDTPVR